MELGDKREPGANVAEFVHFYICDVNGVMWGDQNGHWLFDE